MTPAARLSAAIEVLDRVLAGMPAEQALTNWARANRFAGSGDRHALRDLVYDAIRCRRSFAGLGGAETGRGLILGGCRDAGLDPDLMFTGAGYAPPPLGDAERRMPGPLSALAGLDCPDWLAPELRESLGQDFIPVMQALRRRAPVFLRVNLARGTRPSAQARLLREGIVARPHALAKTALEVTENARKIHQSQSFSDGFVELQDAASQAIVAALPLRDGMRVLDYCAGGGGKSLAMAAEARLSVFAHDVDTGRMRDLPARAARAGATIGLLDGPAVDKAAPFDLVLADAPCSGSGSWRRAPEAKWALTPERLRDLCALQAGILDRIAPLVDRRGLLAYATCSLLDCENAAQIARFQARHPAWRLLHELRLTPLDGGDGFYLALLTREEG